MWKSGLGKSGFAREKLMYSTQKLSKSTKKDNSVPTIILMLSSVNSSHEEFKNFFNRFFYSLFH